MSNRDDINENRRRVNKLTGAGILTALTGGGFLIAEALDGDGKDIDLDNKDDRTPEPPTETPYPDPEQITLEPNEFKQRYNHLDSDQKNDVLSTDQYETWFENGEDSDYEELQEVEITYNPGQPIDDSLVTYTAKFGEETQSIDEYVEDETAQDLLSGDQ